MINKVITNNKIELIIFICICLSRLIVADFSNSFHSVDVGNYILAVYDYNIALDRPHMPGYFLYVYFFKFLAFFFSNSNALFVVGQAFFQALSSIFIYKIIKEKFDLKYNILIIAFIYSIPLIYFYGIISEIYSVELLTISVFLYLIHKDKVSLILPFMALVFGVRQSSGIFLVPAIIYIYYYHFKYKNYKIKHLIISLLIFTFICLLWFIPLVNSTGGFSSYLDLLSKQNEYVNSIKFINNLISFITYSFFYIIPISFVFILSKRKDEFKLSYLNTTFILIIVPQLLFYIFYHYNKGYALLFLPALVIFIMVNYKVKSKIILIATIFNLSVFYFLPGNIPSYNTQIKREYRDKSVVEVWAERFQFWWLPTLSSHDVSVVLHNDIENNRDNIYNIIQNNVLFIDNSLIARGRNISYILPKAVIIERTYLDFESYDRHFGYKDYTHRKDLSNIMKDGYVLIDKEYYEKFYIQIAEIVLNLEYYYIIKVKESKMNEFLTINYEHYGYL